MRPMNEVPANSECVMWFLKVFEKPILFIIYKKLGKPQKKFFSWWPGLVAIGTFFLTIKK